MQNLLYLYIIIWNEYLKHKKYHKFRDNCHYTGEYGGAEYSICNLTLFRKDGGGGGVSPVTSIKVGISPSSVLAFIFNPFVTLV